MFTTKNSNIDLKKLLEPRKPIIQYNKSKVIQLTFTQFKQLDDVIKIPYCQTDLKEEKIEELKESFNNNRHFFASRCLLTVAKLKIGQEEVEYYLVDGQHRKNMILDMKDNSDEFLLLAIIDVSSHKEYKQLFDEINKDSDRYKCKHLPIFEKEIIANVKELLEVDYNALTPRRSNNTTGRIYTINEFADKLLSEEIIIKLCPNRTPEEIVEFLKQKEKIFFEKFKYLAKSIECDELFKDTEKKIINKRIGCMFMKRNNFLHWLLDETIQVDHAYNKRPSISPELRASVWEKEFKSKSDGGCPIFECSNRLYRNDSTTWESGHIKSHFNNGETTLDNLRPICKKCNNEMKETNWDIFENTKKKLYLIEKFEGENEMECDGQTKCKNIIYKNKFYIVQRKKDIRAGCEDCFNKFNK